MDDQISGDMNISMLSKITGYHRESIANHRKSGKISMRKVSNPRGGIMFVASSEEAQRYLESLAAKGKWKRFESVYSCPSKRNCDCAEYPACLDTAARANTVIKCKDCKKYKLDPMWIVG